MTFSIMPYTKIDGIPTFTDSSIRSMYNRIVKEEKKYIFSDGTIPDADAFVLMAKSQDTSFYVVYHNEVVVLVVWLNRFESAVARLNFCSLNGVPRETKIKAGKYLISELTGRVFDLLIGHVPKTNEAAVKYAEICGAKILGEVPNLVWNESEKKSEPGIILYYGRQDEDIQ